MILCSGSTQQEDSGIYLSFYLFFYGSLRIAPTFLISDSWSLEAGFIPIISNKGNKSDKERKNVRKNLSFMHKKKFNTFFKRWVQLCVGAIPRLPG